jgi:hypothetical protein
MLGYLECRRGGLVLLRRGKQEQDPRLRGSQAWDYRILWVIRTVIYAFCAPWKDFEV